ncbi:hypothetical protein ABC347_18045 [Sphingomonas sp. 1P06PA]
MPLTSCLLVPANISGTKYFRSPDPVIGTGGPRALLEIDGVPL